MRRRGHAPGMARMLRKPAATHYVATRAEQQRSPQALSWKTVSDAEGSDEFDLDQEPISRGKVRAPTLHPLHTALSRRYRPRWNGSVRNSNELDVPLARSLAGWFARAKYFTHTEPSACCSSLPTLPWPWGVSSERASERKHRQPPLVLPGQFD